MSRMSSALAGLGLAITTATLAVPVTRAQCPTSREFGGQGNPMLTGRIIIDTTTYGFPNDGNEFVSIWDTANGSAGFGSGDHVPTNPGACPNAGGTTGWYLTGTMLLGPDAGIQGFIGTAGCFPVQCPMPGELISTLVEDNNGLEAGFILYTVENTPQNIRPYDHARTAGIDGIPSAVTTQMFFPYPSIVPTAASCAPPDHQILTVDYQDPGINYHGAGLSTSPTTGIQSLDVVAHHGPALPGLSREFYNLGTIRTVPYTGSAVVGDTIEVPCPSGVDDTFVALGLTFVDPSTGGLESRLVGPAVIVECDCNIADPDAPWFRQLDPSDAPSLGRAGR